MYMLENLLESYPDSAKDRGEAIWAEALEEGLLRLPKHADIVEDGRRDLRYALQVSSSPLQVFCRLPLKCCSFPS